MNLKNKKSKQTTNVWNIVSRVVLVLLILSEALAAVQIWRLEMLPTKYFLIVLAIMAILPALLSLLMFQRQGKWQKKGGHGKQIFAYILCALIIAGCLIGSSAISQVTDLLSSITSNTTVNVVMNVYVLADDPAQSIQDAAGYIFGIAQSTDEADNQSAVDDVESKLGNTIATQSYDTAFAMIDALYAGEINAIILDDSYISVMSDLEGYGDFEARTRLLNELIVEKDTPLPQGSQSGAAQTVKDITTQPFLLYISGNDARQALLADGGSDVNILVAVNPVDKQVLLVNTPRDYYVVNPASGNGSRDKLSHCGLNGIENCIGAISDLYGQPINYYARINFSGFRTLIDAIGGVTVYSDVSFAAGDTYIYAGENYLNGKQALDFARERKSLPGGDNDRGKNQMKLISAMINQLASGSILTNYPEILDSLEGMFTTSISSQELAKLVKMQLSDMATWDIKTFAVTGDNGNDTCWAVGGGYGYVMYPHENMVNHASDLIGKVLSGELLTDADMTVN